MSYSTEQQSNPSPSKERDNRTEVVNSLASSFANIITDQLEAAKRELKYWLTSHNLHWIGIVDKAAEIFSRHLRPAATAALKCQYCSSENMGGPVGEGGQWRRCGDCDKWNKFAALAVLAPQPQERKELPNEAGIWTREGEWKVSAYFPHPAFGSELRCSGSYKLALEGHAGFMDDVKKLPRGGWVKAAAVSGDERKELEQLRSGALVSNQNLRIAELEQQLAAKERNLEMYRETIAGYEKQLGVPQRADSIGSAIEKLQSIVVPAQWLMRDTQPLIDDLQQQLAAVTKQSNAKNEAFAMIVKMVSKLLDGQNPWEPPAYLPTEFMGVWHKLEDFTKELTRLRAMRAELEDSRDTITSTRLKIEGLDKEVERLTNVANLARAADALWIKEKDELVKRAEQAEAALAESRQSVKPSALM